MQFMDKEELYERLNDDPSIYIDKSKIHSNLPPSHNYWNPQDPGKPSIYNDISIWKTHLEQIRFTEVKRQQEELKLIELEKQQDQKEEEDWLKKINTSDFSLESANVFLQELEQAYQEKTLKIAVLKKRLLVLRECFKRQQKLASTKPSQTRGGGILEMFFGKQPSDADKWARLIDKRKVFADRLY